MKYTRPLLLAVSTLALFISACSQPADIHAPSLEPQFGSANEDVGVDVAVSAAGHVYALGNQASDVLEGENFQALLRRYDGSGKLLSTKQLATLTCPDVPECETFGARTLQLDAQGNTYTLVSQKGDTGDIRRYAHYDLYKHDATGKLLKKVDIR